MAIREGFDPLYVANEGRFIAVLPESATDCVLAVLRPHGNAAVIGGSRVLDKLSGDQLPRIC